MDPWKEPSWNSSTLIWILSMCEFPWESSFICQRRQAGGNKGLRVSGWWLSAALCRYSNPGGVLRISWGDFFPLRLWYIRRWGPLGAWGHNSTCECLVLRSQGPKQKGLCWTFVTGGLTPDHLTMLKRVLIIPLVDVVFFFFFLEICRFAEN